MKILFVINSLKIGGAEKMVVELSKAMSKEVEVHVLSLYSQHDNWTDESFNDSKTRLITWNYRNLCVAAIYKLIKLILQEKYDVVHSHLTFAQVLSAICSYFNANPKWVTTEHSSNNNRRKYSLLKYFDRWLYSRFSRVYSISNTTQSSLLQWLGYSKYIQQKFIVVPNAVDINMYAKAVPLDRMSMGYCPNDIILMMVGRLEEAKDPMTIIKSLLFLPKNYKLILVGDGKLREQFILKTIETGVKDRVNFVGAQKDIPRWLKIADIYIQSSHWEGMPTAVLEAMAAGVRTIGSKVLGIVDILPDEMLFEHENVDNLVNLITSVDNTWQTKQKEIINKYDIKALSEMLIFDYKKL